MCRFMTSCFVWIIPSSIAYCYLIYDTLQEDNSKMRKLIKISDDALSLLCNALMLPCLGYLMARVKLVDLTKLTRPFMLLVYTTITVLDFGLNIKALVECPSVQLLPMEAAISVTSFVMCLKMLTGLMILSYFPGSLDDRHTKVARSRKSKIQDYEEYKSIVMPLTLLDYM